VVRGIDAPVRSPSAAGAFFLSLGSENRKAAICGCLARELHPQWLSYKDCCLWQNLVRCSRAAHECDVLPTTNVIVVRPSHSQADAFLSSEPLTSMASGSKCLAENNKPRTSLHGTWISGECCDEAVDVPPPPLT
jgi:hypothetical protein